MTEAKGRVASALPQAIFPSRTNGDQYLKSHVLVVIHLIWRASELSSGSLASKKPLRVLPQLPGENAHSSKGLGLSPEVG